MRTRENTSQPTGRWGMESAQSGLWGWLPGSTRLPGRAGCPAWVGEGVASLLLGGLLPLLPPPPPQAIVCLHQLQTVFMASRNFPNEVTFLPSPMFLTTETGSHSPWRLTEQHDVTRREQSLQSPSRPFVPELRAVIRLWRPSCPQRRGGEGRPAGWRQGDWTAGPAVSGTAHLSGTLLSVSLPFGPLMLRDGREH